MGRHHHQRNNAERAATALLGIVLMVVTAMVVTACTPITSGKWYDTEKGTDGPSFWERVRSAKSGRAIPPRGTGLVRSGDTYYRLAVRHKVPLSALLQANNAKPPYALAPGDRVKLPRQAFYKVRPKDTLYSISRRFNTDVSALARLNRLTKPYTIGIGQALQVPSMPGVDEVDSPANVAKPVSRTASPQKQTSVAQAPRRVGRFRVPVQGAVISDYGPKQGGLHNDGINIAARTGTPIKAAENGVVVYAGNELRGYGNLLLLRHSDGWVTAYAHASKFLVKPGDRVRQGQTIAEVGQTGNVDRPQLHFELRKGTRAVNPKSLI